MPGLPGTIDTIPDEPIVHTQKAVHFNVNENIGGFYEALPPDYNSSTNKYPLLLFLHGGGELGDGVNDLSKVLKHSIPKNA